jgi:hypothetical protein
MRSRDVRRMEGEAASTPLMQSCEGCTAGAPGPRSNCRFYYVRRRHQFGDAVHLLVAINANHSRVLQRFTAAHELGH